MAAGRDLSAALECACRRPYSTVTAEWNSRKDFTYQWRRQGDSVHMTLPDYLDTAPDPVLSEFIGFVCRRSAGSREGFPALVTDHVSSDTFILEKRPIYISRSRNLARTSMGVHADLCESVQRLLDGSLLTDGDVDNSYISWTVRGGVRRVGFCSPMFRVVGVSSRLDSSDVTDVMRDYVVYHECLHLRQGRMGKRGHDAQFRGWERSYPGWQDIEKRLSSL